MPPRLQLSLGSGDRPRGVNGFPLLVAAECLNMQDCKAVPQDLFGQEGKKPGGKRKGHAETGKRV